MNREEITKGLKEWYNGHPEENKYLLITVDENEGIKVSYRFPENGRLSEPDQKLASLLLIALMNNIALAGAIDILATHRNKIITTLMKNENKRDIQ